jgi:D-beta-D-heptose 7-phosphate kinase/D-beta-D-heptose 1-phosphate adenosyltransferase
VIDALAELQNRYPHLVVVDSKRLFEFRKINITAVKPNYKEALSLLGVERPVADTKNGRVKQMEQEGKRLLELLSTQILVITLDHDGALVFEQGQVPYRTYAKQQPNSKAAGAGDTFVSALTLSLASGLVTENAAELASAAASIVVNKDGTSACYADELRSFFSTGEKVVTDVFQLAGRMASYRRDNKQVVFTNGCFDILHRGHINYLNRAKSQGDILIVGVNSDEGVRRLKGPSRPINSLEDRAQILAALSCVDHIVPFDADTPHDLIRVIKPDIFVKGGDYTRETLPEASLVEELGGEVRILPYLDDHSTTGIIEKIRKLYAESPTETA